MTSHLYEISDIIVEQKGKIGEIAKIFKSYLHSFHSLHLSKYKKVNCMYPV